MPLRSAHGVKRRGAGPIYSPAVSFRLRLALFFALIVVVPMVVVAALVVGISSTSRDAKADARLDGGVRTTLALYRRDLDRSRRAARVIAADPTVQNAINSGDSGAIRSAATSAAAAQGAGAFAVRLRSGESIGHGIVGAVALAPVGLTTAGGSSAGSLEASTTRAGAFTREVRRLTGLDAAIIGPAGPLAGTVAVSAAALPDSGSSSDLTVSGRTLRATSAQLPGPGRLQLAMIGPIPSGGFLSSRPAVAIIVGAFIALALALVVLLLRSLGGQVAEMLGAARRIGAGDFKGEVPVQGNDELAGLAREFNRMSVRLGAQVEELRRQRDEIERSVERIGEAVASGLDRQALLGIMVETALEACNAAYGVIAIGGRVGGEAEAGTPSAALREALLVAEEEATRTGGPAEHAADGAFAIAAPIAPLGDDEGVGVMSLARRGRPFTPAERDVFHYLLGQAVVSIENIALHEIVSEQAVTDDLTGLSNKRRFRDVLGKEAARATRFGHPLSLLMLDIDGFKRVNDTRGHVQGDEVLRRVARTLQEESRTIDEPARYGGEEFAIALPETDLEGAISVAERIRSRIEREGVPAIEGGRRIKVTASVGVATIPTSVSDPDGLVRAADAALYEAKRAGKNRVCKAPTVAPVPPRAAPAAR
jgi:diguanylate cyclase (GGDEF)-like protein